MKVVTFSPLARQDLLEIWHYLYFSSESEAVADAFVEAVRQRCRALSDAPHLGRSRPDIDPGVRSLPYGSYLIIYREREDGIDVLRVSHGMRRSHEI